MADVMACARCYFKLELNVDISEKTKKDKIKTTKKSQNIGFSDEKNSVKIYKKKEKKGKQKTKPKLSFDTIAENVLDILQNSQKNIFLTGKAGTGKTTLLKYFLQNTTKSVVVLAPTGVAALNIEGATIHSFFRFDTTVTVAEASKSGKKSKRKELYTKINTIVIDEISMVRADLLDCINAFLQEARDSHNPFGGVQMIFV